MKKRSSTIKETKMKDIWNGYWIKKKDGSMVWFEPEPVIKKGEQIKLF